MSDGETLRRATDYFHPFPNAEEVFANRVKEHSEYLLPIAIVALDRIIPGATGKLPIAMPIEPVAGWGEVGYLSVQYHNYLCRPNWIGYRLIDGKLELATDFRYFHKAYLQAHPPLDKHGHDEAACIALHYEQIRDEFEQRRHYYRGHRVVRRADNPYREALPLSDDGTPWTADETYMLLPLANDLGGFSEGGNWEATDFPRSVQPLPSVPEDREGDEGLLNEMSKLFNSTQITVELTSHQQTSTSVPKTADGREFIYVGCFDLGTYVGDADGWMLAFYDPVDQLLLTTFDWS